MLAFARGLDRGSYEPGLILFSRVGPLERLLPEDVTVIDLARPRLRQALPALLRRLRELRPEVVVSSFGYVNLALLASRRCLPSGTRLVLREANLPSLALPQVRFGGAMRYGYRRLYHRADRVICSSRANGERVSRKPSRFPVRARPLFEIRSTNLGCAVPPPSRSACPGRAHASLPPGGWSGRRVSSGCYRRWRSCR